MMSAVTWPLERNVIRQTQQSHTFGMVRKDADGKTKKPHQGWDLAAKIGTPVYSIAEGQVVFVTHGGDYGLQVCISFLFRRRTYYAFYAHMQEVIVCQKQSVKLGQRIGLSGNTGINPPVRPEEDHLHFEVRTIAECGTGLWGRVDPVEIYGFCPLIAPVFGRESGLPLWRVVNPVV
jgi:murein DD-endopeptidase MepM/ murein hydrolase activator NlpD